MNRALRVEKLERRESGGALEVVKLYPGETPAEAWSAEQGSRPQPTAGLVVFIRKFSGKRGGDEKPIAPAA